jgi:hypothetical protein
MDKLTDLIKQRLSKHHLKSSAQAAEVLFIANQFIVELIEAPAGKVKAYKYEASNLFVAAQDAVWRQELWGVQSILLDKLRKRFGEKALNKIVIKSLTIG